LSSTDGITIVIDETVGIDDAGGGTRRGLIKTGKKEKERNIKKKE
jgi:hypothetical protein